MGIQQNLQEIRLEIPNNIKLVAISKTKTANEIMEAYHAGQKIFGENKVQEMVQKYEVLPKDIEWHMVGHLQSNKIKYIAPFVHFIHSVDSLYLLKEINKQAIKHNRIIKCLLQVHIAQEETKFGFNDLELKELHKLPEFQNLTSIQIVGLMGMATFTNDTNQIRQEFKKLKSLFLGLKSDVYKYDPEFKHLSMGMSSDYAIAIEEGSTMVRIGSKIFGERQYANLK
jgi:PLP dependent protein